MNRSETGTDPGFDAPAAFQSRQQRWTELARDLRAAAHAPAGSNGATRGDHLDVSLFETRPTILRRMAALMADLVAVPTDRLAARTPVAPLVTALSLETGLPFVLIDLADADGTTAMTGEVHAGEHVLLIEDVVRSGSRADAATRALRDRHTVVSGVLAAVDLGRSHAAEPIRALFTSPDLRLTDGTPRPANAGAS